MDTILTNAVIVSLRLMKKIALIMRLQNATKNSLGISEITQGVTQVYFEKIELILFWR